MSVSQSGPSPLNCLKSYELIAKIKEAVSRRKSNEPAFTLILGAGFSAGIIPTTLQMMHEEVGPWDEGIDDEPRAGLPLNQKRDASRGF